MPGHAVRASALLVFGVRSATRRSTRSRSTVRLYAQLVEGKDLIADLCRLRNTSSNRSLTALQMLRANRRSEQARRTRRAGRRLGKSIRRSPRILAQDIFPRAKFEDLVASRVVRAGHRVLSHSQQGTFCPRSAGNESKKAREVAYGPLTDAFKAQFATSNESHQVVH